MKKRIAIALAGAACLLAAGAARAGNVYWSVGISTPPVATVISNAPVYAPAPVYVAPPPVVYQPAPVIYQPAPVVYQPAPVVYQPAPRVVYRPVPVYAPAPVVVGTSQWGHGHQRYKHHKRHHKHHWKDRDHDDRYEDRYDDRYDEYGQVHRDGRWAPAEPRRRRHD